MARDSEAEADERALQALDDAWNDVYAHNDRAAFAHIIAHDFSGWFADGRSISKAQLMAPSDILPVAFSERSLQIFGPTAVARGRIRIERPEGVAEQRFVRIYSKRNQGWQAIAVQVFPIVDSQTG